MKTTMTKKESTIINHRVIVVILSIFMLIGLLGLASCSNDTKNTSSEADTKNESEQEDKENVSLQNAEQQSGKEIDTSQNSNADGDENKRYRFEQDDQISYSSEIVEGDFTIGISQFAQHGSLDNCREGFLLGLAERGFVEGENLTIDYQNAGAEMAVASQIAENFVGKDYDMIMAVATPPLCMHIMRQWIEIFRLFTRRLVIRLQQGLQNRMVNLSAILAEPVMLYRLRLN